MVLHDFKTSSLNDSKINRFTTRSRKNRKIGPPITVQQLSTSTKSTINYRKKQHRNGSSLTRQTTLFSVFRSLFGPLSLTGLVSLSLSAGALGKENPVALYINDETIWRTLERNHVNNNKKKALRVTLIVYRNSLKKLESLDRSGILQCRHNNFDVINGVHSNRLARKKGSFPQSAVERTNNAALYTI